MSNLIGNIGLLGAGSVSGFILFEETLRADGVDDPDLSSALELHNSGRVDLRETIEALLGDPKRRSLLAKAGWRLGHIPLFASRETAVERAEVFLVAGHRAESQPALFLSGSTHFQNNPVRGALLLMSGPNHGNRSKSYANLGAEVIRLREGMGLMQKELAERAGFSRGHLSMIERGRTPGRKYWAKLEKALGQADGYFREQASRLGYWAEHVSGPRSVRAREEPRVGLFKKLGGEIARLRVKAGLTQLQLAERLKIDFTALLRIESGRSPGWKCHAALEEILGLPEKYFQGKLREWGLPVTRVEYRAMGERKGKRKQKYEAFGSEIKRLRVAKGWTRDQLADRVGMSFGVLNQMEIGRCFGFKYLGALERVFEIPEGTLTQRLRDLGFPSSHLESTHRGIAKRKKVKRLRTNRKWKLLGDEVRRLRLEKGWTQKKLSKEVKISRDSLQQLEYGGAPIFRHHSALARALGLKEDYFSEKLREWGLPQSHGEAVRRGRWRKV